MLGLHVLIMIRIEGSQAGAEAGTGRNCGEESCILVGPLWLAQVPYTNQVQTPRNGSRDRGLGFPMSISN